MFITSMSNRTGPEVESRNRNYNTGTFQIPSLCEEDTITVMQVKNTAKMF